MNGILNTPEKLLAHLKERRERPAHRPIGVAFCAEEAALIEECVDAAIKSRAAHKANWELGGGMVDSVSQTAGADAAKKLGLGHQPTLPGKEDKGSFNPKKVSAWAKPAEDAAYKQTGQVNPFPPPPTQDSAFGGDPSEGAAKGIPGWVTPAAPTGDTCASGGPANSELDELADTAEEVIDAITYLAGLVEVKFPKVRTGVNIDLQTDSFKVVLTSESRVA